MNYEKIRQLVNKNLWEEFGGEERCVDCGLYRFQDKHEEGCLVAEILSIVEEGLSKKEVKPK